MRLVAARTVFAVGALGLTASGLAVGLADEPSAIPSNLALMAPESLDSRVLIEQRANSGPVAGTVAGGSLAAAAPASAVADPDGGLNSLSALATERELAESRALQADEMLETVRIARKQAAEAAARSAERERLAAMSPRELGQTMAADRGWTGEQWSCLDSLWQRESGWNPSAQNRSSGAYGIPQSLPGSKMGTVAGDWQTNPATQITWGLNYIRDVYGTPCGAWGHSESHNWY